MKHRLFTIAFVTITGVFAAIFGFTATISSASAATGPGWVAITPRLIGDTPLGFQVWVDPAAPHHAVMAADAAAAVQSLRSYGINITWRGYGRPSTTAEGIIAISEGSAGCAADVPNRAANTYPAWTQLPNGDLYMIRADTVMCPNLYTWSSWQWKLIMFHELGHAVGLGHVTYSYAGSLQMMNPQAHQGVTTYQQGDIAGLRWIARNSVRVKQEIAPLGRLDQAVPTANNTITISGWALTHYYLGSAAIITVTDNGRRFSRTSTSVLRTDVNKAYDPHSSRRHGYSVKFRWPGGTHTYCVTATSSVDRVSTVSLGCVRFSD